MVYFSDSVASRGIDVPVWDLEERSMLPTGHTYIDVYDAFRLAKLKEDADWQRHYHGGLVASRDGRRNGV